MVTFKYVFGRLPQGDLVYFCDLSFYRDFFFDPNSLEELRAKFKLLVCSRGEYGSCVDWDGDMRGFKPAYVPPLPAGGGFTRWWIGLGYFAYEGPLGVVYITLSNVAVSEGYAAEKLRVIVDVERLGEVRIHAVGGGELIGAELPVVRHRDRYLRVGEWLAWHRVAGVLDDGKWVLLGDDGLYEAVFRQTVKNPLGEFGEIGYVKVLAPYGGAEFNIASPCGAPRLVACNEEGQRAADAVLDYVRRALAEKGIAAVELFAPPSWRCSRPFVIPELVELEVPNDALLHWPLTDPCPHVLKIAAEDPLGLTTPSTCYTCWD